MHYIYLAAGIAIEILGSTFLKMSDGFQKKMLGLLCLASYAIAYYLVAVSMKVLPLNIPNRNRCSRRPCCRHEGLAYGIYLDYQLLNTQIYGTSYYKRHYGCQACIFVAPDITDNPAGSIRLADVGY